MRAVMRLLLVLALLLPLPAWGRTAVPRLASHVTDTAGLLSETAARQLEAELSGYEKRTGHQFAFLSLTTLDGTTLEEFGQEVGKAWGLGDEKRDDGLIFLVSKEDRGVRIEVGYGLEGVITDALSARVIRRTIVPAFRAGDFDGGVKQGFQELMRAASGEALEDQEAPPELRGARWIRWLPIAIILILYLLGSMSGPRGGRRFRSYGGLGGFPLGGFGGRGFGGGGFGGGGFGGGGFGGGGFGGGGGGFGGGGASGRW